MLFTYLVNNINISLSGSSLNPLLFTPFILCVSYYIQHSYTLHSRKKFHPISSPNHRLKGDWGVGFNDDVIESKHFPLYWPFGRKIHRSPVNSPHKGQRRRALMFSLICWTNGWVNNRRAGVLRRHSAHYDITVMMRNVNLTQSVASPLFDWHAAAHFRHINITRLPIVTCGMFSHTFPGGLCVVGHCSTEVDIGDELLDQGRPRKPGEYAG